MAQKKRRNIKTNKSIELKTTQMFFLQSSTLYEGIHSYRIGFVAMFASTTESRSATIFCFIFPLVQAHEQSECPHFNYFIISFPLFVIVQKWSRAPFYVSLLLLSVCISQLNLIQPSTFSISRIFNGKYNFFFPNFSHLQRNGLKLILRGPYRIGLNTITWITSLIYRVIHARNIRHWTYFRWTMTIVRSLS